MKPTIIKVLKLAQMAFALFVSSLILNGCSTIEKTDGKTGADIGQRFDETSYENLIYANTQHEVRYEGFYNKFEIYATFLNSKVQSAILQKRSDAFQWDARQAQNEREKMFQENTTQTKFQISFFTPSVRINDLHKGNSIWKIYLESNGQRYEGKAKRVNNKLEDVAAIFPYHNRWSIAYEVIFPVPLSAVESGPVTFVISSTQGSAKLDFK
jgi:hypothetical protein